MSRKEPFILITKDMVSFTTRRADYTVRKTDANFKEIKAALQAKDTGLAYRLIAKAVKEKGEVAEKEVVEIEGVQAKTVRRSKTVKMVANELEFDGTRFHEAFAEAYALSVDNGAERAAMDLFFQRLSQNPNPISLLAFTSFMAKTRMPLTDRGTWLAYKRVDYSYLDHRTHQWDNRPGFVCTMPRQDVDNRQEITCSTGFHVCSHTYLKGFARGVDLVVEIDPRDVVAVPPDYNLSKMRLSSYRVLCTLPFFKKMLLCRFQDALGNIPYFETGQMDEWEEALGCPIQHEARETKGKRMTAKEWSEERDLTFKGTVNPEMKTKG